MPAGVNRYHCSIGWRMPRKKSNAISFGRFFAAASSAARVVNVLSDRVNFFTEHDAVKGNAVMVALGEMKNFEKFRFIADGCRPAGMSGSLTGPGDGKLIPGATLGNLTGEQHASSKRKASDSAPAYLKGWNDLV
jgi:hypothetical protein